MKPSELRRLPKTLPEKREKGATYLKIATPKLNPHKDQKNVVYPYYAGFSEAFVDTLLSQIDIEHGATVLDPWNGSGTTTAVAFQNGFKSVGLDLNPVMVVAAKARVARCLELRDAKKGAIAIAALSKGGSNPVASPDDPLSAWFSTASIKAIRRFQFALHEWIELDRYATSQEICDLSNGNSLLYLSFLVTVSRLVRKGRGSNVTWVRRLLPKSEQITISLSDLRESFLKTSNDLIEMLSAKSSLFEDGRNLTIKCGDSRAIPVKDASIDCVLTSPPYCTRIDYAVATSVEHAVIAINNSTHFDLLRKELMGTTTIRRDTSNSLEKKYKYTSSLLLKIKNHDSYAAESYYFKNISQYFLDLEKSLKDINRAVKSNGWVALVVQDSFFKDIHIDLALSIQEIAESKDWHLNQKIDFKVNSDLFFINQRAISARNKLRHIESLLLFKKP